MGQAGPLVVLGEDEHLGLARKTPKGRGVEDPIAIPLKAGPKLVRRLLDRPVAATVASGGTLGQRKVVARITFRPSVRGHRSDGGVAVVVGGPEVITPARPVPIHGRGPDSSSFCSTLIPH
tara:strand:- start:23 stop:385 length:363 start_codon:yes stop_codon:yes gene_type:complete